MEYRIGTQKFKKPVPLKGPKDAIELVKGLGQAEIEVMTVLHVTPDLKAIEAETVGLGSMMSVAVESRSIFRSAVLSDQERCLIEVHNHAFQRKAEPSIEDREHMSLLRSAGLLLGIPVLDSIILGTKEHFSSLEQGFVYPKCDAYPGGTKLAFAKAHKFPSAKPEIITPGDLGPISAPKMAVPHLEFLRKMKFEATAVIRLTPDLEPTAIEVFRSSFEDNQREETRDILRRVIASPSTKYIILANNHRCFPGRMYSVDALSQHLYQLRFGGISLCTPVIDMLEIEPKGYYSWTEHGQVFNRSKFYSFAEAESIKVKGPSKTNRPDIPPYAWIIR